MYILGINAVFHESAACLLENGKILASAEEERFNRIKHGKPANLDNPDELPWQAIQYCLDSAGVELKQIGHIGYSFNPRIKSNPLFTEEYKDDEDLLEKTLLHIPEKLKEIGFQGEFHWVNHHTAHAASAYYVSPFQDAAILVVDGTAESSSTSFFSAKNNQLKLLQEILYPASLGALWELFSVFLGFDGYDAAKVMGLAAYGNPNRYAEHFKQIVRMVPNGQFEMDNELLHVETIEYYPPSGYFQGLEELFSIKNREPGQAFTPAHQDIAASLQAITDDIVLDMTQHLYQLVQSDNLCLAGGVALNCVSNTVAFEKGPFTHLFVQPAAHDGGTALGSAFYIWNHVLGNEPREQMTHAYLGPSFTDSDMDNILQKHQLIYKRTDNIEKEVAQLISENNIVGFFQGRMELGPRALGNRSLLADPRHPNMREIFNLKVKHREYFRPLAPSVLHEEANNWFTITKETSAAEFMLMAYPVKPSMKEKIPAVVHVDGTSRVQRVKKEANPRYHQLISEFYRISGVPIVLNTSFNDSEPIVCTPQDAINTFLATEIDYMAMGNFLVSKADNR